MALRENELIIASNREESMAVVGGFQVFSLSARGKKWEGAKKQTVPFHPLCGGNLRPSALRVETHCAVTLAS
jgi:hypothetical protein